MKNRAMISLLTATAGLSFLATAIANAEENNNNNSVAPAAAAPATPVSMATPATTPQVSELLKRFNANYVASYAGGALSDLGGSYQPDENGLPSTVPQQVENLLGVYYKLSNTVKVGGQAHFYYSPIEQRGVTMYDPLLQISSSNLYSNGAFKLGGYARGYVPLTDESAKKDRLAQFRFMLNGSYEVTPKLVVGCYGYLQPAFYRDSEKSAGRTTLLAYAGPNLSYAILKNVQLTALYEMTASKSKGANGGLDFSHGDVSTDFEPGVNWDITPNVSVNPYLNIYTGNKISWDSTGVGILLVATLL